MNGSRPAVSGRTKSVENTTLRGIYEAIERERVRQGIPLTQMMDGAWSDMLRRPNNLYASKICRALDALDMDVILINKEGEQV